MRAVVCGFSLPFRRPRMGADLKYFELSENLSVWRAQGQYGKAEPLHQRWLTILEKALGPEHSDVATFPESIDSDAARPEGRV